MEPDTSVSLEWNRNGQRGKGTMTALLVGEPIHVDTLDINSDKARGRYLAAVRNRCPGISEEQAADLALQLTKLAAEEAKPAPEPQPAAAPERADLLAKMPEAVVSEARAMLESPKLMQQVVEDIGLLGVAGERELAATVYLAGTSRMLTHPLAVIVQGPSSSGKSYVVKAVANMFPPEVALVATALTPQALYYMPPGSLVNRFVVVGERSRLENDDTAEATRALREMLSEGRLCKWAPIKVNGQQQTVQIQQDGPIAYIESTTLAKIFDEDANRCILVNTDEQPEQTRRILNKLASMYSGAVACDPARIRDRHHAAQRLLEPHSVVVPFAERLAVAIDHHRVEARRAFPHLVSMIQASALLHQRQRSFDADGRLLATSDDYQIARHLLGGPMARQLGSAISQPAARFLMRLREWFGASVFTKPMAKAKETRSKSAVYGWISELTEVGAVELVTAQRGKQAAELRIVADAPDADATSVLPPVAKVFS